MSTKYKFLDPEGIYFVSFATVGWADVFTRLSTKISLLIALDIASIKKTYFACLVSDDESCSSYIFKQRIRKTFCYLTRYKLVQKFFSG